MLMNKDQITKITLYHLRIPIDYLPIESWSDINFFLKGFYNFKCMLIATLKFPNLCQINHIKRSTGHRRGIDIELYALFCSPKS